jgi:hypothetical protein
MFIRRNLFVVLAIPPVVAGCFGVYAKMLRSPAATTTTVTATDTTETNVLETTELTKNDELLKDS